MFAIDIWTRDVVGHVLHSAGIPLKIISLLAKTIESKVSGESETKLNFNLEVDLEGRKSWAFEDANRGHRGHISRC